MMNRKHPYIKYNLAICVLLCVGLFGCEEKVELQEYGQISGKVVSSSNLEPLDAVSISTNPATSALLTDDSGRFEILEVPTGSYSVRAKKNGYATSNVDISVKANRPTEITITMETADQSGSEDDIVYGPRPKQGSGDVFRDTALRWSVDKREAIANMRFDVYLYESNQSAGTLVAEDIADSVVELEDLRFGTTYYWQVIVKDNNVEVEKSPVWTFTTEPFPDNRYRFARSVDGSFEIFSSDSLGESSIQLTNSPASAEIYPRLNPQRNLIAFTSNRNLDFHIYTMNREGQNMEQITSLPVAGNHNNGAGYCWSPDGGEFLYSHFENLYKIDRNGTDRRLVATAPQGRHFRMVDWTQYNGGKIIAQTIGTHIYDSELYIMDEDGSNMELLVSNYEGRLESPSFSVDGNRVMYTLDANGLNSANGRQLDARIYTMNLDSTDVVNASLDKPNGTNDLFPRYSPDGAHIVFMNTSNTGLGDPAIYIMDLNGENREKLFDMATMPDWF